MNRIDTAGEDRNSRTKKAPKDYKTNSTPKQEENDQISAEFKVGSWPHPQKIKQPSEGRSRKLPDLAQALDKRGRIEEDRDERYIAAAEGRMAIETQGQ